MFKYTLICLYFSNFFLSNFLEVTGANWYLQQDVFDRVKAACEDEDFLNPSSYSSRLEGSISSEQNSHAVERKSSSESPYPEPQIYAGWQPSSPPPEALDSDRLPHGNHPASTIFDKNLERLSDLKVSPAERLADYRKIEVLWGQRPFDFHTSDIKWRSFWLFKNLWAVSQGKMKVSPDFKEIILKYLARDRSKPLAAESIVGLRHALLSKYHFEKEVAQQLLTQILKEDVVSPEIHRYWTPVHNPQTEMKAYVREVLDHLKDYSTPLWDRINSYDDLASRAEHGHSRYGLETVPYDHETSVYYFGIRNAQDKRAMIHSEYAQRISKYDWRVDSLRKLVQQLHALDRSQASAIIELRKALEKASKDTSLDYIQMFYLNTLQKVFFEEHFPDEERAVREAMTERLKNPNEYNGEDQYSRAVDRFLDLKFYSVLDVVKLLMSTSKTYGTSSTRSENILDMIRHFAKFDLNQRAHLRLKLKDAVIIPTNP